MMKGLTQDLEAVTFFQPAVGRAILRITDAVLLSVLGEIIEQELVAQVGTDDGRALSLFAAQPIPLSAVAPPAWSICPWVSRMVVTEISSCSMAETIRSTSPPGSTITPSAVLLFLINVQFC